MIRIVFLLRKLPTMHKQATLKRQQQQAIGYHFNRRIREGIFIVSLAVSLFFLLSLLSYHRSDPGWLHTGLTRHVANSGGRVGAVFADVFFFIFGYLAYLFPLLTVYSAYLFLKEKMSNFFDTQALITRAIGILFIITTGCGLLSMQVMTAGSHLPYHAGGILGQGIVSVLVRSFNETGTTLLLLGLFLTGITFFTGVSWLTITEVIGEWTLRALSALQRGIAVCISGIENVIQRRRETRHHAVKIERPKKPKTPTVDNTSKVVKPVIAEPAAPAKASKQAKREAPAPSYGKGFEGALPSIGLLDPAEKTKVAGFSNEKLELMSREVEKRLLDFGVEVQVVAVHPGPVITRFEMQLAPGVKVSKISGLSKDLARSLSVTSVRIVDVIPGKSVVGLELPNDSREMVRLSEVLATPQYEQARSPLSMALGKDIAGNPVIVDLAKMPHLLVAGTTGSGKSVGLNAMLLSILYKATPSEVRLILIDPKMLELSVYNDIPHLLTPVVTDMKDASQALRWCVVEMERRYRLMSHFGVRNLSGFNQKIRDAEKAGKPLNDPFQVVPEGEEPPFLKPLPSIVVVIDELADMMMVVGKKVEQLIARIAQKARAAGIHMILATQRPSVDVLTGLIKSNIPTRMAFQVSSKVDSRTILDQQGAESLLGHGDMLYLPPGYGTPVRVHGAFVDDHEVHKVAEDWKRRGGADYLDDVIEGTSPDEQASDVVIPGFESSDTEDKDELYDQAVEFVTTSRRATISSVQRRFKIGYNRAARLIEEMERTGVVSAAESNGARDVLAPPPVEHD